MVCVVNVEKQKLVWRLLLVLDALLGAGGSRHRYRLKLFHRSPLLLQHARSQHASPQVGGSS